MPEGPEVRRAADRIERAVAKQPLVRCVMEHPVLAEAQDQFQDVVLESVDTYGKAFVLNFSNQKCIYVHLQLYGRWVTGLLKNKDKTKRTLRMRLETETHFAALYSATDIFLLDPEEVPEQPFIKKIGPDLLKRGYRANHVSQRLAKPKFARRKLGGLLLDQSVFAGLGNYLRSEVLFRARLHPGRKLGSLSNEERKLLASMIYGTTQRAYATGGITVDKAYVERAKQKGWTRRAYRHYVFDRENRRCPVCDTSIEKIMSAGRRLYFCPQCQPTSAV